MNSFIEFKLKQTKVNMKLKKSKPPFQEKLTTVHKYSGNFQSDFILKDVQMR